MTKEDIKNKWFNVFINNRGKDGETLCFKVYNDILGEFVIDNCYYNTDPTYFVNAHLHLNGSTSIRLSDETKNFFVTLTLDYGDLSKGQIFLRC